MDSTTLNILSAVNLRSGSFDAGIDRLFAYPLLIELLPRKEIQVVAGLRRTGKTVLLRQCMRALADRGIKPEQVLFVPCDNPLLGLSSFRELDLLLASYADEHPGALYFFLDEIQAVKGWERYLKSAYDSSRPWKFVISGSSAHFFAADTATLLTGRHFFHRITTLGLEEYFRFRPEGSLGDYLSWGGFPEVVLAENERTRRELLQTYLTTVIERDIIRRARLRDRRQVRALLEAVLATPGGKLNSSRLASQFRLTPKTVERYLAAAADAFLISLVPHFSFSKRKSRHTLPKAYPADYGFTRLLVKRVELGRAAEWAVQQHLGDATYWSSPEGEIDFITGAEAIQVTFADEPSPREWASLPSFCRRFKRSPLVLARATTERTTSIEEFLRRR